MGFHVEVESTLSKDWTNVCVEIADEGCVVGVRDALKVGEAQAKLAHKYKSRTGELERKTAGKLLEVSRFGAVGELKADTPYASFVEKGTKPHEITVRKAPMLHWVDEGGDDHFAITVQHPGTDPMPFLEPTIPLMEHTINARVESATERAQRHLK